MKPSELRRNIQTVNPFSHFFDKDTMEFFGDTMDNYGVNDTGDCWELYRKNPVKNGLQTSAWFEKITYKRVFKD